MQPDIRVTRQRPSFISVLASNSKNQNKNKKSQTCGFFLLVPRFNFRLSQSKKQGLSINVILKINSSQKYDFILVVKCILF